MDSAGIRSVSDPTGPDQSESVMCDPPRCCRPPRTALQRSFLKNTHILYIYIIQIYGKHIHIYIYNIHTYIYLGAADADLRPLQPWRRCLQRRGSLPLCHLCHQRPRRTTGTSSQSNDQDRRGRNRGMLCLFKSVSTEVQLVVWLVKLKS